MKKKMVSMMLVGAMALSLLVGCGGGSSEKSDSGETTLELFSTKAENVDVMTSLAEKFNESHEGVTIEIVCPADAGTVLKTRMAKNDMPDIIAMGGNNEYTEVQSAGMLLDLSGEDFVSTIQESYLQMVYDVNGDKEEAAYGIPYATNASGILYNVDKFAELGLEVPTTWDELIAVCDAAVAAGETPFLFTFLDSWTCLCPWNSMAPDLQPANFTDDRLANKTTFVGTHEEVAEKYLQLLDYANTDYMGLGYDDGNKAFANGEGLMMINGNWAINQFTAANPEFNCGMFAFPASNDTSVNYVTSGVDVLLAVSATTENTDIAKEFVAFMLEPENCQTYIDDQFAFSAVVGVEQENASVAGVKEDIANGKVANFPDHYYPSAFDLGSLLSEFALNYSNGMDNAENVSQFLKQCDEKYDVANVQ